MANTGFERQAIDAIATHQPSLSAQVLRQDGSLPIWPLAALAAAFNAGWWCVIADWFAGPLNIETLAAIGGVTGIATFVAMPLFAPGRN